MKCYCSNCGIQLKHIRKAVPKFGTILDLIEPHVCLEVPVDPMKVLIEAPISTEDQNKFVQSLNDLKSTREDMKRDFHYINYGEGKSLRPSSMTGTDDLRDRRFDGKIPSTAPSSVLDQIKQMSNSIPVNEVKDDSEMGD